MDNALLKQATKVKNRTPAAAQITAEQILQDAWARTPAYAPKQISTLVATNKEGPETTQFKRLHFEEILRRNRGSIGTWIKYAAYETNMSQVERARSVYERALEVEPRNVTLWLK